jgi:hypothetical protein
VTVRPGSNVAAMDDGAVWSRNGRHNLERRRGIALVVRDLMRFTELRRTGLPIGEENDRAERLFPVLIEQSRLHLWRPGDPIAEGRRLLVGVATWSLYDLSLLEVLDLAVKDGRSGVDRIGVFDVDRVERGDFEDYIPGLGKMVVTPVAAIWEGGILVDKRFGWWAIRLISGLLGVSLEWNGAEWRWDVLRGR